MPKFAQNFEMLLDRYRRSDGRRWQGTELAEAAQKLAEGEGKKKGPGSSYISAIRTGAIENPGGEPLRKIARVVGFPNDYWYLDPEELRALLFGGGATEPEPEAGAAQDPPLRAGGRQLATLINDQIAWEMLRRQAVYTDRDVAAATGFRLTERDVGKMRRGMWDRLEEAEELALSDAFGVEPRNWHEGVEKRPLLTPEAVEFLLGDERFLVSYRPDGWTEEARGIVRILSGADRRVPGETEPQTPVFDASNGG